MNPPTQHERSLEDWERILRALDLRIEAIDQEQVHAADEFDWLLDRGDEIMDETDDRQRWRRMLYERRMAIAALIAGLLEGRDAA